MTNKRSENILTELWVLSLAVVVESGAKELNVTSGQDECETSGPDKKTLNYTVSFTLVAAERKEKNVLHTQSWFWKSPHV